MTRRSSKRRALQRNFDVGPSGRTFEVGDGTREKPIVIEAVDDVAAFLDSPGYYQTTSAFSAYAVFKALGWHPKFRLGMELYNPEGAILFGRVLDHGETPDALQANPGEEWGEKGTWKTKPDWYANITRDYGDWRTAWWREATQNSRDAGATKLKFDVTDDVYADPETGQQVPCVRVSVEDNGSGMTKEILRDAFFTRGGTYKPRSGSAGGFGDAKMLLLLAHYGYEITTTDVVARGVHEDVWFKPAEKFLQGTRLVVWMPLTFCTTIQNAQKVIELSNLKMEVLANGQRIVGTLPGGTERLRAPIRGDAWERNAPVIGEMIISYDPDSENPGIFVRSRGIFTWQDQAPAGVSGSVIVEVDAPPIAKVADKTINIFDQKRNGFSYESSARLIYDKFKEKLAKDVESTLMAHRDKKRTIFLGSGSIEREAGRVAEMAAKIAAEEWGLAEKAQRAREANSPMRLTKEEEDRIRRRMEEMQQQRDAAERQREEEEEDEKEGDDDAKREKVAKLPPIAAPLPAAFSRMMDGLELVGGEDQIIAAIQLGMWQPHFMLAQEISPWDPPPDLLPQTMSLDYWKIRQFWVDVCKFLLVQLGMNEPFGVGWVIDDTEDLEHRGSGGFVAGAHVRSRGMHWLMLNPIQIATVGTEKDAKGVEHRVYRAGGPLYDLSNVRHLREIAAVALHEITHMQGFSSHNESFTSAEKENMPAYAILAPHLEKIAKVSISAAEKIHAAQVRRLSSRRSSKPREARGPAVLPGGAVAFSWTRQGNEWVLREGYVGQRGRMEIMRYEGGVGYDGRYKQRFLDQIHARIVAKLGDAAPSLENTYVWIASSPTEWFMRLSAAALPASETADSERLPAVSTYSGGNGAYIANNGDFEGLTGGQEFDSVAEAQKAVMGAVVRQRAGR